MDNYDNLCMGCMKPLTEGSVCPRCKTDNSVPQNYPYLPLKTILNDQYLVGEMIEHTSDGVTYMGYDLRLKTPIRIREFMPRNLSTRIAGNNQIVITPGKNRDYQECLLNFLELWRSLAKMRELSAIIPVYDIFELYGTAYAISENMEYVTLRDYLLRSPEGNISWDKARSLLMPVLSTLIALHNNGIIHRAISPTNLVVCKDGKVRLTGFSIWQSNSQQSCLVFQEQSGYNALEQYDNNEKQGPWTDVYGFATTLYRPLVLVNHMDALTRAST
ncbi:MAG: protein kinase, partial [Clostridiales bacterium]|nr:protein kinase [Clostridiales bacterium]